MDRDMPESAIQDPTIEVNTELDGEKIARIVSEHLDKIPYGRLAQDLRSIDDDEPPMPLVELKPDRSGYGVSVAMLLWSICFFAAARYLAAIPSWLADICFVVGFGALLMAILGLCVEVFKRG